MSAYESTDVKVLYEGYYIATLLQTRSDQGVSGKSGIVRAKQVRFLRHLNIPSMSIQDLGSVSKTGINTSFEGVQQITRVCLFTHSAKLIFDHSINTVFSEVVTIIPSGSSDTLRAFACPAFIQLYVEDKTGK